MSGKQNWNDIGEQIRDAVQGALSTGDFKELNDIVAGTVNAALYEAKKQASEKWDANNNKKSKQMETGTYRTQTRQAADANGTSYRSTSRSSNTSGQHPAAAKRFLPAIRTKKVGNVSGMLLIVFGGIGLGLACIAVLVTLIILMAEKTIVPLLWSGACLAGFIYMIDRGCMRRNRLKRAERYVQLCGGKSYIDIEDLALHIGKSRKYVLKDVKKMIKLGIFPEGHLDAQESCLILDDATFREYLKLQKERKALEMEQKVAGMQERQKAPGKYIEQDAQSRKAAREAAGEIGKRSEDAQSSVGAQNGIDMQSGAGAQNKGKQTEAESDNPQLAAMIREGNDCIRRLREMNDAIEGEVISAKLYQLENLLKEIFARVKEHPEQMPQMRKFMDYYLPTTLKLVEAYAEFDAVSVPGEDINSAKAEIEKTLDTINQAFAELLNKLYREAVYDVTTDAQVLQTMLANEGLTGGNMGMKSGDDMGMKSGDNTGMK